MTIVPSQGGCERGCSLSSDDGVNDGGCKCEKQCTYVTVHTKGQFLWSNHTQEKDLSDLFTIFYKKYCILVHNICLFALNFIYIYKISMKYRGKRKKNLI